MESKRRMKIFPKISKVYLNDTSENLSEKEWEVEELLSKRIKEGKIEYLIKWKNYDVEQSTWEPIVNLVNCTKLIEFFESNIFNENKNTFLFDDESFSLESKIKFVLILK